MNLYSSENFEVVFESWCQEFPGYCIISSKKENLSELTSEEWIEIGKLEKELERVIKKIFDATMFNFACLMNNAYRDSEIPHVHFHFVPRYDGERFILNKKYKDRHFGYNFWKWANSKFRRQKDLFTEEERLKIFEMMKEEFKI